MRTLVSNAYRNAEFLRQTRQLTKELRHLHLTFTQFPTTHVVSTKERSGAVYYKERVAVLRHDSRRHFEQFHLMLRVVRTSTSDILQCNFRVQTETLRNSLETIGTEGTFRVNVDCFAYKEALEPKCERTIFVQMRQGNLRIGLPSAPPSVTGIWHVTQSV